MNYIIIPYRDRKNELDNFLNYMPQVFDLYLGKNNWKVMVIEQMGERLFNRGKLLNAGFLIANDSSSNFIFHDIDTLPITNESKERYSLDCSEQIIGIYNSVCNTLGGIIKCTAEQYKSMNGFPNTYWGWGCEDKALQNRMEFQKISVNKKFLSNPEGSKHFKLPPNDNDDTKRIKSDDFSKRTWFNYTIWNTLQNIDKLKFISRDGINTCNYELKNTIKLVENIYLYNVEI